MGRTDEEIRKARDEWMTSDRFGEIKGYDGPSLAGTPSSNRFDILHRRKEAVGQRWEQCSDSGVEPVRVRKRRSRPCGSQHLTQAS
ncbi:hypothetical protein GCM10017674_68720 [Streptomyces gardneri]|uniref:Uncharacterized protein n=1 Tax=Streptomyces gardneri TaxID=66892 RepID=A0A4Y3RLC4_9ACTN|nr:hypothetical protein SGA01_37740 [Streptomyces gardneri]GHH17594.1 hypothetical protein GCM10017674_68720 [Streptomyces gardneri]